ncbi:MAG: hypothetical protein BGO07_03275 [Alphaproteobacteria bacterium 40-19]|nr:MAG: hypothetical protein BGO07_03275 [Alphaproteobacteria bacterium 40-19]
MPSIIQSVRDVLQESIDSTPEQASRFFKTNVGDYAAHDQFMGISVPKLRKIAKKFRSLNLEDLALLLQSVINEERLLALIILNLLNFTHSHLSFGSFNMTNTTN